LSEHRLETGLVSAYLETKRKRMESTEAQMEKKEEEELEFGLEAPGQMESEEPDNLEQIQNGGFTAENLDDEVDQGHMEKEEIQEILAFQRKEHHINIDHEGGGEAEAEAEAEEFTETVTKGTTESEVIDVEEIPERAEKRQQVTEIEEENADDDESDDEKGEVFTTKRREATNIKGKSHPKRQVSGEFNSSADQESSDSEDSVTPGLPSILLEFEQQFFWLFNDPEEIQTDDAIFYGDRKLLDSAIDVFLRSLKTAFEISTDVTIEFPQLELSFPQDLVHAKSIKLRTLINFNETLQSSKGIPKNEVEPLKVVMFNHHRSLVQQYNKLLNLYRKGGRAQNPIILSDEEEESGIEIVGENGKGGESSRVANQHETINDNENLEEGTGENEKMVENGTEEGITHSKRKEMDDDDDDTHENGNDENNEQLDSSISKKSKLN